MEQSVQSVIENRIIEVYIPVQNYELVEPFYKEFLGLPLKWGNGKCLGCFDMQGVGILIVQTDEMPPKIHRANFAIAAKDIDAAYTIMSNAGVTVSEIKTYGNGQRAFGIADPEGNMIDIIKYPLKN